MSADRALPVSAMPDPRLRLTAQDLAYAARGLRVLARQAEAQAADPAFHASREIFRDAAQAYEELAGKCERVAQGVSKAESGNCGNPAAARQQS